MGIMVWVVSASRAIPASYKALELNEAAINWFSPMSTYNDVVSAAADEAGGQGFVTEQAGPTDALTEVVVYKCDGSWLITLPQGDAVHGTEMGVWPTDLGDQPAARKILQFSTKGDGEVVEDNSDKIRRILKDNGAQPKPGDPLPGNIAGADGGTGGTSGTPAAGSTNAGGCRIRGGEPSGGAVPTLLLGLALAARLLRRRSR